MRRATWFLLLLLCALLTPHADAGIRLVDGGGVPAAAYTTEEVQDDVGAMVDATLVYADATPLLTRAALTGDVTAAQASNATTIAADAVTNAKLANMATATIKGRTTAGTGDPEDLTGAQATALLSVLGGDSGAGGVKGLAPAPAAGDAAAAKFLKADGTWAAPTASLSGGAANKLAYWTSATALSNDTDLHWNATDNNLGVGTATFGTSLTNGISLAIGASVPSTSPTNTVQLYASDQIFSTNAALFVRAEAGEVSSLGSRLAVNSTTVGTVQPGGIFLENAANGGSLMQFSNNVQVAHGMTTLVPTTVFYSASAVTAGDGGVLQRAFTEGSLATIISSVGTTDPVSTKSTAADAALRFEFAKKSGTTQGDMAAGTNLIAAGVWAAANGTRWILDYDGDTWQTGSVTAMRSVEANTAVAASPNLLDGPTETMKILTNEGATAMNYHTLPPAVVGLQYTFYVQDADGLRIVAGTGDTIRIFTTVSTAAGYCESTLPGGYVTLVAINVTEWVGIGYSGPTAVWTCA